MVTIKVDTDRLNQLKNDYEGYIAEENVGYILFVIKKDLDIITAYLNKKNSIFKVTIQGPDEIEIAKKYSIIEDFLPKKYKTCEIPATFIDIEQQIGSDEVGTGDFFGPIVVCAAYSDKETIKLIDKLGIADSKKLTDTKILNIVPQLLKRVHYSCKIIKNSDYNDLINKGYNMNAIKAFAHNYCLSKLHQRCPYVKNVYVDQFTPEEKYYNYLATAQNVEKNIIFREKGESFFPSVALASCIARYTFLKEIEKLNEIYKVKIPLGANKKVDEFAKAFIDKFGKAEFDKIVKQNFKNYAEALTEEIKLV